MNTFSAHLSKDWHEQRRGIVALLVLALLAPLASLFLPEALLPSSAPIAYFAALVCGSLAALMLASDLVPREVTTGASGVGLLARLPKGLQQALHGKFLLFAVGSVSAALLAWSSGAVVDAVRGGLDARAWGFDTRFALFVAAAVLPWLFTGSTLVTRGMWTAPVALLSSWPAFVLTITLVVLATNDTHRVIILAVNSALAYLVARAAFVGGHASGRSPRRAVQRGAVALVCVSLPLASYMAHAFLLARSVDPTRPDFRIRYFVVDSTGERVWIDAHGPDLMEQFVTRRWHTSGENRRAFVVDIDAGTWEHAGPHDSWIRPVDTGGPGAARPGYDYVSVSHRGQDVFRNATTKQPLDEAELGALVDALKQRPQPPMWYAVGRAEVRRAGPDPLDWVYVDPQSGLQVASRELIDEHGVGPYGVTVRGGSWLIRPRTGGPELFDPLTRATRPAPRELENFALGGPPMMFDGRFAVLNSDRRLVAVDPDAPQSPEDFAGLAERFGRIELVWIDELTSWTADTGGPVLAHVHAEHGEPHYVALALDPPRLVGGLPSSGAVERRSAWLDDSRALVLEDNRRLVELDFARGTRRVVFPR